MIYGYDDNMFPVLTTKHIELDNFNNRNRPQVKVKFCMTSLDQGNVTSWFNNEEITDQLDVYFLIMDDETVAWLANIDTDNARTELIASIIRSDLYNMRSSGAFFSIPLREVLLANQRRSMPASQMPGYYRNQVHGEVSIPYTPLSNPELLTRPLSNPELLTRSLHLVSFIHMRVDERGNQGQIGGNLVYDFLCNINEDGILTTSQTRNAFYIRETSTERIEDEQGVRFGPTKTIFRPYSGPAHYHGEVNPGPDNYIGWMAGHSNGAMGPKLEVRSVPNYKVSLGIFYHDSRVGSESPDQGFEGGYVSALERFRSLADIRNLQSRSQKISKLVEMDILSSQTGQPNIIDYGTKDSSYINLTSNRENLNLQRIEKSHYGCVIGIDFLKACMFNSQFGRLLQYHSNLGNTEFINKCLYHSNIIEMQVLRRRVANIPERFNNVSSLKYTKYEKNQPDVSLISSSDLEPPERVEDEIFSSDLKYRLKKGASKRASIEEIDLFTRTAQSPTPVAGPRYSRQFVVRDYDMFYNVNSGKYTYIIKLKMKDGIKKVIQQMLSAAIASDIEFSKYIYQASIPLVGEGTQYQSGNYNYTTKSFSDAFKTSAQFDNLIERSVMLYSKLVNFITGNTVTRETQLELISMLSPAGTSMDTLEYYQNLVSSMIGSMQKMFANFSLTKEYEHPSKISKSNPANAGGYLLDSYDIETRTGIIVDSFSSTTLLADFNTFTPLFNILSAIDFNIDLAAAAPSSPDASLFTDFIPIVQPDRFVSVESSPYIVDTEFPEPFENQFVDEPGFRMGFNSRTSQVHKDSVDVTEISTKQSFENMSRIQKINLELKIDLLRDKDAANSGIINKDPAYFDLMSKKNFGISLFSSETDINNSLSSEGDEIMGWLEKIIPNSTKDFRVSIYESAYRGDDKDHFFKLNEEVYETLATTREQLGSLYDSIQNLILSNNIAAAVSLGAMSQKDRYLGIPTLKSGIASNSYEDCYKREESIVKVICPGTPSAVYNPRVFSTTKVSTRNMKSFIFVKFDPTKERSDAIVPVNNGYFLEI